MENLYGWVWLILLAIGVAAGIKIYITVRRNRNQNTNNVTSASGSSGVSQSISQNNRFSETGPMVYFANDRHGRRDKEYQFNYKIVGGSWRAYILRMPNLGNRDSSGAVTHRLYDNGRPYVCWDTPVNSLKDMQTISRVWADNVQEYIATGRRFG